MDIAASSAQQQKQGFKSDENPVPFCISWDASKECVVTGRYWAVWGHAVRKKEWVVTCCLGQSGLKHTMPMTLKCLTARYPQSVVTAATGAGSRLANSTF